MVFVKNLLKFIATNFIFLGGLLFIFGIGVVFAYLRPQGILVNAIFLIITIGWIIFMTKYFWDVMEKNKKN